MAAITDFAIYETRLPTHSVLFLRFNCKVILYCSGFIFLYIIKCQSNHVTTVHFCTCTEVLFTNHDSVHAPVQTGQCKSRHAVCRGGHSKLFPKSVLLQRSALNITQWAHDETAPLHLLQVKLKPRVHWDISAG